jgi:hypothetical protein
MEVMEAVGAQEANVRGEGYWNAEEKACRIHDDL